MMINGTAAWAAVILAFFAALSIASCAGWSPISEKSGPALETVSKVDLERYMGLWYEVARYPNRFQKGCHHATAEYTLANDGVVKVVNRCREDSDKAKTRMVEGQALVVDKDTNAKLKVTFFWPFYGAYWIIGLDKDYRYAVVGEPKRKYLWILSRTTSMDDEILSRLKEKIREKGYDPAKLIISQDQS